MNGYTFIASTLLFLFTFGDQVDQVDRVLSPFQANGITREIKTSTRQFGYELKVLQRSIHRDMQSLARSINLS